MLDKPLQNNIEYRCIIPEADTLCYGNSDVESLKKKYKNSENKPLFQVGTKVKSLFEKDNAGTLFDEALELVRVVKSYYDFVMTYNEENCIDRAESIDEEIDDLHLKGEDREAIVNLRVNQNVSQVHIVGVI